MTEAWVNLVVALLPEAKPLVERFELAACDEGRTPFPCFEGHSEGNGLRLVVSGIGKFAAATAVGHLSARTSLQRDAAWLNVGVGGHRDLALGETRLANKVAEAASGRTWFPPRAFRSPCRSVPVLTVDEPETGYRTDDIYDMEAAGFFSAATRYSTAELVQSLKVVSDNAEAPLGDDLRQRGRQMARQARSLIEASGPVVERVIEELWGLCAEAHKTHTCPEQLTSFRDRWRFTVAQQSQLRDLLRRWEALTGTSEALRTCEGLPHARAVLQRLGSELSDRASIVRPQ